MSADGPTAAATSGMSMTDAFWSDVVEGPALDALLRIARDEDLGPEGGAGDITSQLAVPETATAVAEFRVRRPGVVAGLRLLPRIVEAFAASATVRALLRDGSVVEQGTALATIEGSLRGILAVERTALNLLGHLGGIATATARFVEAVHGTTAVICETRKTTPGLRALEKYAVRCGGGTPHRLGLFDAVLLKDNHLAGLDPAGVAQLAAKVAEAARGRTTFIEVEVDDLAQLDAILALPSGTVDIVLLDNMSLTEIRAAVGRRNARGTTPLLEASGGITIDSVRDVADCGVDRIAVGALTHSVATLDVGLDVLGVSHAARTETDGSAGQAR